MLLTWRILWQISTQRHSPRFWDVTVTCNRCMLTLAWIFNLYTVSKAPYHYFWKKNFVKMNRFHFGLYTTSVTWEIWQQKVINSPTSPVYNCDPVILRSAKNHFPTVLLWAPAQRKRATMLYFCQCFFYLFIFLWPPYSPALVNGSSRKFYTWWTLSGVREVITWIFSWSSTPP